MANFNKINGYDVEDTNARNIIGNVSENNTIDPNSTYAIEFKNQNDEPLTLTDSLVSLKTDLSQLTGDLDTKYKAADEEIKSNIAVVQNDTTATIEIPKGKHFLLNNKLKIATKKIEVGDNILSSATGTGTGVNCKESTTIEEQLEDIDTVPAKTTATDNHEKPITSNAAYMMHFAIDHNVPRWILENGSWHLGKNITSYISAITNYDYGNLSKIVRGTNGYLPLEDIYAGDYFEMSHTISAPHAGTNDSSLHNAYQNNFATEGTKWVTIAGINTLMNNGDSNIVNYPHLVLVPGKGETNEKNHFGQHWMNKTNITTGGYAGSIMHKSVLGKYTDETTNGAIESGTGSFLANNQIGTTYVSINSQLKAEFGSHLKTTNELLSNAVTNTLYNRFGSATGASSKWGWFNCQSVLMSEVEVYGSIVWSSSGYDIAHANVQLPLFKYSKACANNRSSWYWLKAVTSSTHFADCSSSGDASDIGAGNENSYVRPRFVIA